MCLVFCCRCSREISLHRGRWGAQHVASVVLYFDLVKVAKPPSGASVHCFQALLLNLMASAALGKLVHFSILKKRVWK